MNLLSSIASCSSNVADLFTKLISRHRFDTLIGDIFHTTVDPTSAASTTSVARPTVAVVTSSTNSDSVPTTTPVGPIIAPTLPIVLDTGASLTTSPFKSDFLPVTQAPYGLIRSAFDTSVASDSKAYSGFASTPVDPYTLITGEDVSVDSVDLSSMDSTDTDSVDTLEFATALEVLEFREFGTATLIFISDPNSELESILVEPTIDRFDWLDWIPLPRLTPTESYFHILGRDYLQALALFHLIPIWIALVSLNRSE